MSACSRAIAPRLGEAAERVEVVLRRRCESGSEVPTHSAPRTWPFQLDRSSAAGACAAAALVAGALGEVAIVLRTRGPVRPS